MTSWGNTRQRAAAYAAVAFYVLAIFTATSHLGGWALLLLLAGVICTAGVWALGLPKSTDPDAAEWSNAIR